MHKPLTRSVIVLLAVGLAVWGVTDAGAGGVPGNSLEITSPVSGFITSEEILQVTVRFTAGPPPDGQVDHPGRLVRTLVLTAGGREVARFEIPAPAEHLTHTFALDTGSHPEGTITLIAQALGVAEAIAQSPLVSVRFNRDISRGDAVGPMGGIVTTGDGSLTLAIPPGALPAFQWISARRVDPAGVPLLGGRPAIFAYELRPSGLQFAQPVEVNVVLDRSALLPGGGVGHAPVLLFNVSGGVVERLADPVVHLDGGTGTVTASGLLSHFSTLTGTILGDIFVQIDGVPEGQEIDGGFTADVTVSDTPDQVLNAPVFYVGSAFRRLRQVDPPGGPPIRIGGLADGADRLTRTILFACTEPGPAEFVSTVFIPAFETDESGNDTTSLVIQWRHTLTCRSVGAGSGSDADQDGVADAADACLGTALGLLVDGAGCAANQRDSDGDTVNDAFDTCPNTEASQSVDASGCAANQRDGDEDGVLDDLDICPGTDPGLAVDGAGCAAYQRDSDSDGLNDADDLCPLLAGPSGGSGCPLPPGDSDFDGVPDFLDDCPGTRFGDPVDDFGCPLDEGDVIDIGRRERPSPVGDGILGNGREGDGILAQGNSSVETEILVVGETGYVVESIGQSRQVISASTNDTPFGRNTGGLLLRDPGPGGEHTLVIYGLGLSVRRWIRDEGRFGIVQAGSRFSNFTDGVHFDGDPDAHGGILVDFAASQVFGLVAVESSPGQFFHQFAGPLADFAFPSTLGRIISAFAANLLFTPSGSLSPASTGRLLVVTDGDPGLVYLVDPASPTAGTLVGSAGRGPRTIRCLLGRGFCVVANFLSNTLTIVRWDGGDSASIVGEIPVGAAIGIDIRAASATTAEIVSPDLDDDTLTFVTLDEALTEVSRQTVPIPGCGGAGHALYVGSSPSVLVSCETDSLLVRR